MQKRCKISIKKFEFEVIFKKSITSDLIWRSLPIFSKIKRWGEEIYFDTPLNIDLDKDARSIIEYGEIAFWSAGSAIAIGYGKTPVSQEDEIRLISPANVWADCEFKKEYIRSIKEGETVLVEKF